MKNVQDKTRLTVTLSLVAALYTSVSIALAPVSFGFVQFRIAESLTILPVFSKKYIYAITLGCFLTNFIGVFLGVNIAGPLDIFIGTLATLIAGYLTYALRNIKFFKIPVLSILPPIIINGIFIGSELTFVTMPSVSYEVLISTCIKIMIDQIIPLLIGLVLYQMISSSKIDKKYLEI